MTVRVYKDTRVIASLVVLDTEEGEQAKGAIRALLAANDTAPLNTRPRGKKKL